MRIVMAAVSLTLVAAPAVAQDRKKGQDPNRVICRTEEATGSRLQSERRCLTAGQWAELQRQTREELDRRRQQVGAASSPQI